MKEVLEDGLAIIVGLADDERVVRPARTRQAMVNDLREILRR